MAAFNLIDSDDQINSARIAHSFVGGNIADFLPDRTRPWMKPKVQDSAAMLDAFNLL